MKGSLENMPFSATGGLPPARPSPARSRDLACPEFKKNELHVVTSPASLFYYGFEKPHDTGGEFLY